MAFNVSFLRGCLSSNIFRLFSSICYFRTGRSALVVAHRLYYHYSCKLINRMFVLYRRRIGDVSCSTRGVIRILRDRGTLDTIGARISIITN